MNICLYNTEDYVPTKVDSLQKKKLFTNIQIEGKNWEAIDNVIKTNKI